MRWCSSCLLPDTRPNLRIEEDGRCNACHTHGIKEEIDWEARERSFKDLVEKVKLRQDGCYDCLVPVSGGKDSTWQTIKCLEHGLRPLAVTWKPPGRTRIGQMNLDNLVSLGVDHIDYQINPQVEAEFMWRTFEEKGSTAIPMHLALFNIPLKLAVQFKIPLIIWGENSAFEYGASDIADTGFQLNAQWLERYGVTQGTTARDWEDESLDAKALNAYRGPSFSELEQADINAVFLGYYFKWDPAESNRVAQENGFKADTSGARVGIYNYADIDDDFISIHHWMKWYKFGFTRTFDNLSLEIRNGRISRSEALDILMAKGDETPIEDIEKFCSFAKISVRSFMSAAENFRNQKIWTKGKNGCWYIDNFLRSDWKWS